MDNTKSFKDSYKYNAKKVMQIIEKNNSKQNNYTKSEIKQEKEKG